MRKCNVTEYTTVTYLNLDVYKFVKYRETFEKYLCHLEKKYECVYFSKKYVILII